jgi:flavodoxin I
MKKSAIIYSFNSIKTKKIAERIMEAFGKEIEAVNAEELTRNVFEPFDNYILGSPTWFDGELANYWDEFIPELEDIDLKSKTIAIFGLGDQKGYPENFGDAVGILAGILENRGARIVGFTSLEGYSFESSKARKGNQFCGLLLDQENQARLTSDRVEKWVESLRKEFK